MRIGSALGTAFFSVMVAGGCVTACSGEAPAPTGASESAWTADGGADADADADAGAAVASYTLRDRPGAMRWSIDGAAVIEAGQVEPAMLSGSSLRFQITGAQRIDGALSAVVVQLGRGTATIAPRTYDCSAQEAAVVLVGDDDAKLMTPVNDGPSRPCKVIVEATRPLGDQNTATVRSSHVVVGRIEAYVGPRDNAAAPTKQVRAAFSVILTEFVR